MSNDQLHRYLFEDVSVRGELVKLDDTYQRILENQDFPAPVNALLGEMLAATSLLTATLKFNGSITVQLQGDGPVSLAVINGDHHQQLRGTARVKGDIKDDATLPEMMGKGQLIITIEPVDGERYQGIVGLESDSLQACLEDYFARSEQLMTRLWLRTGEHEGKPHAAGMMLQVLPDGKGDEGDFEHLAQLTDTIKNEELFSLPAKDVLHRLYHQEKVTLYPAQEVVFKCSCSRERSASAIAAIERSEVDKMVAEMGTIHLHCDYCGTDYAFDSVDVAAIFEQNADSSSQMQ
ncbi:MULTISPECIES: Hsp33 family molecular chaperone HslO [Salinivibrio]|jgi:Disulfide bond chaperones of the HSP33 family|uniref:33 kDa chaperonin n=1 Tax=Salinivibrio kushneri TaxID=1908198 RepID=A0AB36K8J3_9GAMM|nr:MULTISPECIES: Hsp33 family molecular chaperone HslO [Salinivibrio]ODP99596.1 Hsp33 family molecular chaperone [Salinivibrio sp. BNH]OOE34801.1 Hsp33 family molecular chaperone [Salinivibrio kushneri]OOE45255.1 Hsp33 family molecular chaperone [Salinivibrio kushneri]OOE46752.1 Hsp33 family molecular chaperone [Salinivibrio kushneri]OOE50074.1 Hsp33 family molecular chaperone [Salinivibrio kushneri]